MAVILLILNKFQPWFMLEILIHGADGVLMGNRTPLQFPKFSSTGFLNKIQWCVLYLSNKARGVVVYGQYTTAKGCSYAQRNLPIGHIPLTPEVPYCYSKLVTNIIRAVKINVLSYPWFTVWYTTAVSQSTLRDQATQFRIARSQL
jgi:hypothetical protein